MNKTFTFNHPNFVWTLHLVEFRTHDGHDFISLWFWGETRNDKTRVGRNPKYFPTQLPSCNVFWKELFFNKSHKHFELKVWLGGNFCNSDVHIVYPYWLLQIICLQINWVVQLEHREWCGREVVMCHLNAPLVVLYKQYPRFIHLLVHVNRHIFVYRFVYPLEIFW